MRRTHRAGGLTDRQRQLIALLRRGFTNREIADELRISEDGVKAHLSRLYLRYAVGNRVELLAAVDERSPQAAGADRGALASVRSLAGRAQDHVTAFDSRSGAGSARDLEGVRRELDEVNAALGLLSELPTETTGPVIEAMRKRLSAALRDLDQLGRGHPARSA
jgi:DNA-binding CsgD family transcriptional regulator